MPARGNSCFCWIFLIFSSEMSRQNEPKLGRQHVYKVLYKGSNVTVTLYISLKQSMLLFSLFTDRGNLYLQLALVQCWHLLFAISSADSSVYYRGQWHYIHMTFASRRIDVWLIKLIIRTLWSLMLTQLNVIIDILHTLGTHLLIESIH
jgi:hypothetical protein